MRFFRSFEPRTLLVTSSYVVAETITWLTYHRYRPTAIRFHEMVEASEKAGLLQIVWVARGAHESAWDIFERYDDQVFSFCDCTSFAICLERRIDFVFGFDSDFRTVGLDLRPGP